MGNHGHSHHSGHHHHHHFNVTDSVNKTIIFCAVLNLLFVVFEAIMGFVYNSVGLLSDAGHNFSDVFSLLLALLAVHIIKIHGNGHFTYGYKKATVLISLINSVILLVAVGGIIMESIYRFKEAAPVSGVAVSWTAAAGIMVNGLTTLLLMKQKKHDLNMHGAFLHMLADTLVSVGVVVSGIIISLKGWIWIDPLVSILIALVILVSTIGLLKESLFLSLDAVPKGINLLKIKSQLDGLEGLSGWHHLHIWPISTTENAATVHVVLSDTYSMCELKPRLREIFKENGVQHCTIECETTGETCENLGCCE